MSSNVGGQVGSGEPSPTNRKTSSTTSTPFELDLDRNNWRVHQLYVKKEFSKCLALIEKHNRSTKGQSEYLLVVKGLIRRHEGRIDEALELFQEASTLNPHDVSILKHIGRCLYLLGKFEASIHVFDEAEKLGAEEWDVWHNKGLCYMKLGKYDDAVDSFQQSNMINRHDETFLMLGRVYTLMNDYSSAVETYQEALEFSPDNPELLTTLGTLYLNMGENYRAFDYLGNSLTHDPKNPRTILAAGSVIQDHNDTDVALVKYRIAATKIPNSAQLWNNIGMCFYSKAKYVAAISCLKRALYLDPFEWIISYNLGLAHLSTGQSASAFHHLSTSINLKPDYARAYMYLAISLSRLQDIPNTINAYNKALELTPDDHLVRLNYAITLFNIGHTQESNEAFEAFFSIWNVLDDNTKNNEPETSAKMQKLRVMLHSAKS